MLVFREMQTKTTMKYDHTLNRMTVKKNTSPGVGMEETELSDFARIYIHANKMVLSCLCIHTHKYRHVCACIHTHTKILLHCLCTHTYKMVQPLWKKAWQFLPKLNINLPHDPAISLTQQK